MKKIKHKTAREIRLGEMYYSFGYEQPRNHIGMTFLATNFSLTGRAMRVNALYEDGTIAVILLDYKVLVYDVNSL